jgi:glycerate-2-kinase
MCRKYFKMVIVRVANPEKIDMLLQPHLNYVKHAINNCKTLENIYILTAGKRNIAAAKAFKEFLKNELEKTGIQVKTRAC